MGKLIVIDGLDGSGKGTQTRALVKYLEEKGMQAKRIDFPRYGTKGATLVEGYLKGELGGNPDDTGAYATSLFFAMDRYWSYRTDWGEFYSAPDSVLVLDRYTTANAVHQCSKLPRDEWDGFLTWLWDTEYNKIGIPKPDKIIFLDMKPSIVRSLIDSRSQNENRAKDIHEKDSTYLDRCYEAALYACERLGWEHICCYEGEKPRAMEDIFADILSCLKDVL